MPQPMRCVALFSGGLDACLAVRMVQQQGIEVRALTLASPFLDPAPAQQAADALGVPWTLAPLVPEYAQRLAMPRLGRIGPAACCLDCRVAMLKAAKAYMEATDSEFVVTGEVLGQRPRTSRFDLELVAIRAGLEGLVVRPLSAQRLAPTLPEQRGWLDRQQLGGIVGKSRKVQQQLACRYQVASVAPRADCPLLAGPLAERVAAALREGLPLDDWLLKALRRGKWYPLAGGFLLVGRNQQENSLLESVFAEYRNGAASGEEHFSERCSESIGLVKPVGMAGPVGLLLARRGADLAALGRDAAVVLRAKLRQAPCESTWRLSVRSRQWEWSDSA